MLAGPRSLGRTRRPAAAFAWILASSLALAAAGCGTLAGRPATAERPESWMRADGSVDELQREMDTEECVAVGRTIEQRMSRSLGPHRRCPRVMHCERGTARCEEVLRCEGDTRATARPEDAGQRALEACMRSKGWFRRGAPDGVALRLQ